MDRKRLCLALAVFGAASVPAAAETYKPARADEILEVLPRGFSVPPGDRQLPPEKLAELRLQQGKKTGDPRAYGEAEAALRPWWDDPKPPVAIRMMRATILQFNHQFAASLKDLDQVLAEAPDATDAQIMKAMILMTTARYPAAQAVCESITGRRPLLRMACAANAKSLAQIGTADEQHRDLERLVTLADFLGSQEKDILPWVLTTAGDIAHRAGDNDRAEGLYRRSLQLEPEDLYTITSLADALLDMDRPAEVFPLTDDRRDQDGLLLRLALAAKRAGRADAQELASVLGDRFAAAKARGGARHWREEAYYHLLVVDDAEEAMALARTNYETQKEPIDRRLLTEAAVKSRTKLEGM